MKKTVIQPHKSSLGMDANIAALVIFIAMAVVSWIPYLQWAAWAVPLIFFFAEKESRYVKFQASTALSVGIIGAALSFLFQILIWILTPRSVSALLMYAAGGWGILVVIGAITTIVSICFSILHIYLIVMAYQYNQVELPLVGAIARKASEKLDTNNVNQQTPNQQWNTPPADNAPSVNNAPATDEGKPKFCSDCGAKNSQSSAFCSGCGKPMA